MVMTKFNGLQLTQISFDLEDIKSYLVAADEVEGEERVERGRREEAVAAVTLEVGFKNISQLTRRYSYDVNVNKIYIFQTTPLARRKPFTPPH